MIEVPRYRMINSLGYQDNENGLWVRYEDHVAAVQAARSQPKFRVGDRVRNDMFIGTVTSIETYDDQEDEFWVSWDKGGQSQCDSRTLTLYVVPIPDPKFKIGDRVLLDEQPEVLVIIGIIRSQSVSSDWSYDLSTGPWAPVTRVSSSRLDLYTPPTPAELIPKLKEHDWVRGVWENGETLREHEWVRGTYKNGIAFGPCSVYYNEIGAMFAGDNNLIHWNTGKISDKLATLERCDAPEVVK